MDYKLRENTNSLTEENLFVSKFLVIIRSLIRNENNPARETQEMHLTEATITHFPGQHDKDHQFSANQIKLALGMTCTDF